MTDHQPASSASRDIAAVIDLGTNTFHLLIATGDANSPQVLYHVTQPVKLGEGGMKDGKIHPAAYQRGIRTMEQFHQQIVDHKAARVKAIATSAIRTTSNGKDFIDEVKAKTGISIETIDGDLEARYIYEGIKAGQCLTHKNSLILDIGGGSVEFIIGNNEKILWKQSFEIGAARLMDKYHQVDPIPGHCIVELHEYLQQTLQPLFDAAKNTGIETLIGSSGAFETFAEVIERKDGHDFDLKQNRKYHFDYQEFINITDWLIESTHFERENTPGIINIRVDMIVVAAIITRFVMEKLGIKDVLMSAYSLKEGVMANILSFNN
jgi:exopolyphosphatase / guanosine-5'-triphosphate,3'-diphosphate pyrophosphatase